MKSELKDERHCIPPLNYSEDDAGIIMDSFLVSTQDCHMRPQPRPLKAAASAAGGSGSSPGAGSLRLTECVVESGQMGSVFRPAA